MESTGFSRLKRFCAMLTVLLATVAVSMSPPALAAAPAHIALVVHLNADGSLTLSQRDKDAGAVMTLPSIQALPAQVEALLPQVGDREKIALAADPAVPYGKFMNLMYVAKKAGFRGVGILRSEKDPHGKPSEIDVNFGPELVFPPPGEPLFVSLGEDGDVILSLGIGDNAHGTTAPLAGALDAAKGLVPKGRPQKQAYFRADSAVPAGTAIELLHKLNAIGFTKFGIVGEQTDENP